MKPAYPVLLIFYLGISGCWLDSEFLVDDKKIIYFNQNLTWNEASSLCRSEKSSLVTVEKFSFAMRLIKVLAVFEAQPYLWTSGRLIHNKWVWKASEFPMKVDETFSLSNDTKDKCLAINIQNFSLAVFRSFNCAETKGLLCEKVHHQPTLLVEEFSHNNHNYSIYEGQSTWQSALATCSKHNMQLALLGGKELQEVALILNSYKHLDTQMVWVGGLKDYKSFKWVSTGELVEHIIHNDTEFSKCLMLATAASALYGDNCNNGHGFLCESRPANDDYWESFVHQNREYAVHYLKATWEKAGKICEASNSYLATVEDLLVVNKIAVYMRNGSEALNTVWLGAKAVRVKSKTTYKWQNLNTQVPNKMGKNGYPPWKVSTNRRDKHSCLVLEQSGKEVYFSESTCDDVHSFVCQRDASVPPAVTFYFKVGDRALIFHDTPKTWLEAQKVCRLSYDRLLSELNTDDLSATTEFVTRPKLWLDGRSEDLWKWKQEPGLTLSSSILSINETCLTIEFQRKFKIAAYNCRNKLPFFCERHFRKEQVVKYKDNEYTVVNKHTTWHEASAICQSRGQNLAIIRDINEAEFLSKLINGYGDLWLGGTNQEGKWRWDATNATLPPKMNKKTGYPPWLNFKARRKHASCLTLTLNLLSHAAFADTSCWDIKSFICEKYSLQSYKQEFLEPRISTLDDRQYVFFPQLSTWKDANEECSDNLAFLTVVPTLKIARHIANLSYGYPEVWIGGVLEGSSWKWSMSGDDVKHWNESEVEWESENEIFDEISRNSAQHLALNRVNPNVPLFVEKGQSERLGFVCERANNIDDDGYLMERVEFNKIHLLLVESKLNYTDASDFCQANNGGLVIANNPELLKVIKKHTKKFHEAWLGAAMPVQNQKFLWTHTRAEVVQKIYSTTGEFLYDKPRIKRSDADFPDEILDKSEFEDEIASSGDGFNENYDSLSLEDEDGDGILESWEVGVTLPNGYEIDTSLEGKNPLTRNARSSKDKEIADNIIEGSSKDGRLLASGVLHSFKLEVISNSTTQCVPKAQQSTIQQVTTPAVLEDTTRRNVTNVPLTKYIYCLKLDDEGKLVASNCSSRQSFVCEIRSDKKKIRVEKYSVGNVTYTVSSEKLSWNKAYKKCNSTFGGYLAIFNDLGEIDFVNNISRDFQDLWIGAKYVDGWHWPYINRNMQHNVSMWSTSNRLHKCANVYREHSSNLILVDKNCSEKHGFICRETKSKRPDVETAGNYVIYRKPANFFHALNICSKHNSVMITAQSSKQVLEVINLYKGLHSFWVSALYVEERWMWLNSGAQNSNISDLDHTSGRECLSVFKNNHTSYSLVDRDCNTYLSFVCANDNNYTFDFGSETYTFYLQPYNWLLANQHCLSRGQHLATIRDKQSARFIQNLALVFGDLWVGATLTNTSVWIWNFTKEMVYNDPLTNATIGIPSHTAINPNADYCLFAHNFFTHSGLLHCSPCNSSRGFVCQGIPASAVPSVESIVFNDRVYTMYSKLSTWSEARAVCLSNGTYLAVIDTVDEVDVLNKFSLSTFWTGGRLKNLWVWDHIGKEIDIEVFSHANLSISNEFHSCLSFYTDKSHLQLVYLSCDTKLPFVCEEVGHNKQFQTKRLHFTTQYLILHNTPLTWDEANNMCEAAGQNLAWITDENANYLLSFPAEYHDLWLGGKKNGDAWVWTELDSEVAISYSVLLNDSEALVHPFIRTMPRPDHNCLSLYRQNGHSFSFLDSNCNDKHGFICQETKYTPNNITTLILDGREYNIYTKRLTWTQANKICKSNGTYLAVLSTVKEIELLLQKQMHLVKLWTGAVNTQGAWLWDHTGAEIALNNYTRRLNGSGSGCGVIKKSKREGVMLLPRNCTSLYGFVCEERGDRGKEITKSLNISGRFYSVHSERATWEHASDRCTENGQHLALTYTADELKILGQLSADFHDLWVGARNIQGSNVSVWTHTGQQIHFEEMQNRLTTNTATISNCLNIYREWNSDPVFISRDCNERHGYICKSVPILEEHLQTLRVVFAGHKYILIQQRLTWNQAYSACDRFNGYLAIIGNQAEANFLSSRSRSFHDLWVGGTKLNETVWKWHYTGQNVSSNVAWQRTPTRTGHDCLNLYSSNGRFGIFMDRSCSEKHSFVCEETHQHEEIKKRDISSLGDINRLDNFLFPSHFLPHYAEFRGRKYMFSNVRVDFNSALDLCKAKSGYLLIFDDQDEREFIGNNSQGYHSMWIGGKRRNDSWIWEHLGTIILTDNFVDYQGHNGHDCLLFYRHDNTTAHYVDRKCQEKHSFVCKDVNEDGANTEIEFTYQDRFYLLIPNAHATWLKAKEYCRRQGAYLAVVDDAEEAQFLSSIGNDLWIDGMFKNETKTWTWHHIGREIAFPKYNILKYKPDTVSDNSSRCLNLYRSFNNSPRFVERGCDNEFGFVCEDLVALTSGIKNVSREYKKRKYLFVNKKLSWQDAYNTCRKNGSYLAIVSTQDEGSFIAKMANNFHDMWIDGRFIRNSWKTIYTNFSMVESAAASNFIPVAWATAGRRTGHDCLSAYLPSSEALLFVDRNCSEAHTFVCEEVVTKSRPETIEYAGVRYTLSMEAVSWEEACQKCSKHGYLAIIDSEEEAAALARFSGEFHSLWTGARYTNHKWRWNFTGEPVNQDNSTWINLLSSTNSKCGMLYRDNFLNPFIVEKACQNRFGYVCEEGEAPEHFDQDTNIKYDGKTYTLYKNPAPWDEARNHCKIHGGTLAIVDSTELVSLLIKQKDYYNFWIDGISEGSFWKWSSTELHLQPPGRSTVNHVRENPRYSRSCLTFFRSHGTARYLDEDCKAPKSFLCQQFDSVLGGNITRIETNGARYYLMHDVKATWFEAWRICAANGSYLPIIKDASSAEFVTSMFSYFRDEAWLGARKLSGRWIWELTKELLLEKKTNFSKSTPLNQLDTCLGLSYQKTVYSLADSNCSSSRLVICEQGCAALPAMNGSWNRHQCLARVQRVGEQCTVSCNSGYIHTGRANIVCTLDGWSDDVPICLDIHDFSLSMVSHVKDALEEQKRKARMMKRKNVGLLFLIGSNNNTNRDHHETIIEVVKAVSVGVRSPNVVASVVRFDAEASVEINMQDINNCTFIQKVDKLVYKPATNVSYVKAFKTAQHLMKNASMDGNSVIFIITSSNNTEKLNETLLHLKQQGDVFIAIGIKPYVDTHLARQLASASRSKYHINVDFPTLDNIASILNKTFLYSGKLNCCMRLKNTKVFRVSPEACARDISPRNTECSVQCDDDYHLQGMESLLCTSEGWQSSLKVHRPLPECLTAKQVSQKLAKTLKSLYQNKIVDSTLFMVDQSGSMLEEDFYNELKFVKHLLRTGISKLGVIVFNSEAFVAIPLQKYSDSDSICSLYNALDSLNFHGGSTNYEKAFGAAMEQIESYTRNCTDCLKQRTLIVMLTDGQNSKRVESAEKLKLQGHVIAVISIAVDKRRNLIELVSNDADNSPLLFSVNTFPAVDDLIKYTDHEFQLRDVAYCCKLPLEFQKQYLKMFVMQNEDIEITCPPGYALSIDNNTLKCTEIGLNAIPTCFAVPEKIAKFIREQFTYIFNSFGHNNQDHVEQQLIIFLVDQTDTMTPLKNKQALAFVKSAANVFQLSETRTAGLINVQNHEAVMLIEPDVSRSAKFSELLSNIAFNATSYSMYKPLKFIFENLVGANRSVLTVIISDRLYISTPSLKLARKILASNKNNIYILEVKSKTRDSNMADLVKNRKEMFVSGYYLLKDNLYSIDSFATLEAVAEDMSLL